MATEYIVTDRSTSIKYSIQVDNGQLKWSSTASAASSEPIFEDNTDAGTYWKLFVDDGQIGLESTLTVQDDSVVLTDVTTSTDWTVVVNEGQLAIDDGVVVVTVGNWPLTPRRRRR